MRVCAAAMAVAVVATAGACGGGSSTTRASKSIGALSSTLVPSTVLNLDVKEENVRGALAGIRRTYLDATSVYSFRTNDLLQATLQVSRFITAARYRSQKFQASLVTQIGGVQPTLVRVGSSDVYLTAGNQQRIAVWFHGRYMYVLATREDFAAPRTLLRRLLDLPA